MECPLLLPATLILDDSEWQCTAKKNWGIAELQLLIVLHVTLLQLWLYFVNPQGKLLCHSSLVKQTLMNTNHNDVSIQYYKAKANMWFNNGIQETSRYISPFAIKYNHSSGSWTEIAPDAFCPPHFSCLSTQASFFQLSSPGCWRPLTKHSQSMCTTEVRAFSIL